MTHYHSLNRQSKFAVFFRINNNLKIVIEEFKKKLVICNKNKTHDSYRYNNLDDCIFWDTIPDFSFCE